jgi:hypothetical protein
VNGGALVGLLDGGVAEDLAPVIAASASFRLGEDDTVIREASRPGPTGHGSSITRTILAAAPPTRLVVAQVFHGPLVAPPVVVAEGLRWLVTQNVRLINMSFGLAADRSVLRSACEAACRGGVVLIAAAPARGGTAFPAAYRGVLAVSGDARCAPGEVSALEIAAARFGAHPRTADGAAAGASAAVAWVSGTVAALLARAPQTDREGVLRHLEQTARYRGPERRSRIAPQADQASPR